MFSLCYRQERKQQAEREKLLKQRVADAAKEKKTGLQCKKTLATRDQVRMWKLLILQPNQRKNQVILIRPFNWVIGTQLLLWTTCQSFSLLLCLVLLRILWVQSQYFPLRLAPYPGKIWVRREKLSTRKSPRLLPWLKTHELKDQSNQVGLLLLPRVLSVSFLSQVFCCCCFCF